MATPSSSGDALRWRPSANHPSPISLPSANGTARPSLPNTSSTHLQRCLPGWQENLFPRRGSATALAPWCRGGDGREGREEGDPVNKPRLNRLLGAAGRAYGLIDIEIRRNPSQGEQAPSMGS